MKSNHENELMQIISAANKKNATEEDVKRELRNKKETTKTGVHNCMMWVVTVFFIVMALGIGLCFCSYFCHIIRGQEVPDDLNNFIAKSVEWVLVAGAAYFASLKIDELTK